jgi:hypothetical protein
MNQLISIQNGRKQSPIFSAAEMENRLAKLRTQMAAENITAPRFYGFDFFCISSK